ncbi:copper-containing nitrite reductase [Haloarchaeobius litoreus]|uniref:Copper-containing nitrite reductase n=1 Tax=Haloarchaeobius litoreus TaxID=755306 RepID=A0ABD6DFW9_9EURY|nr:copper-containing nitrite reductase [Haloarchaeobius litoreus]
MFDTTRRRVVQALGVGGAATLAGCSTGQQPVEADQQTTASATPTQQEPAQTTVDRIAADPRDVPDPVDWNEPRRHEISLEVTEETAEIEPGVTFDYMTFDGRVPGPMIRVRRGDTVNLTLSSPDSNSMPHNIDLHAVYGPGGGADATSINPGESATIEFRAMYPGVHIYHCAVPNLDQHISAGMFGAILVEPEEGLPEVDHEFYFGQHEIYTDKAAGEEGHHAFDFEAMKKEEPSYVVYNGEAYAFTGNGYGPVEVDKGDRVRIFMSNGGPNLTSSWHAIGNVWTDFYRDGALANEPEHYVETAPVAPGTVACAEIDTPVPEPIKLVDHALTRVARKGMMGVIQVNGSPEPDIFDPDP